MGCNSWVAALPDFTYTRFPMKVLSPGSCFSGSKRRRYRGCALAARLPEKCTHGAGVVFVGGLMVGMTGKSIPVVHCYQDCLSRYGAQISSKVRIVYIYLLRDVLPSLALGNRLKHARSSRIEHFRDQTAGTWCNGQVITLADVIARMAGHGLNLCFE